LRVAETNTAAVDIALMQDQERKVKSKAGDRDSQEVAELHFGRRSAQDVTDLEILQHLASDCRGYAYNRRYSQHSRDAAHPRHSDGDHQKRGNNQSAKRESRDRIIGRTDHADQVAGDRREEKSDHDHHYGGSNGPT
jgi:hypothetical protein